MHLKPFEKFGIGDEKLFAALARAAVPTVHKFIAQNLANTV